MDVFRVVSEDALEAAWKCEQTAISDLHRIIESMTDRKDAFTAPAPGLGEAFGIAGIGYEMLRFCAIKKPVCVL